VQQAAAVAPAPLASSAEPETVLVDERHAAALRSQALDSLFAGERRDRAWSAEMERSIDAVFAGRGVAGTALVSAECASTLCRLKVRHDDEPARRDFAAQIAEKAPFAGGVHYLYSPDDVHDTTLYVSRRGK